ncbi:MAG: extracellular solute-binding protein [Patescibacteria group bacterium]
MTDKTSLPQPGSSAKPISIAAPDEKLLSGKTSSTTTATNSSSPANASQVQGGQQAPAQSTDQRTVSQLKPADRPTQAGNQVAPLKNLATTAPGVANNQASPSPTSMPPMSSPRQPQPPAPTPSPTSAPIPTRTQPTTPSVQQRQPQTSAVSPPQAGLVGSAAASQVPAGKLPPGNVGGGSGLPRPITPTPKTGSIATKSVPAGLSNQAPGGMVPGAPRPAAPSAAAPLQPPTPPLPTNQAITNKMAVGQTPPVLTGAQVKSPQSQTGVGVMPQPSAPRPPMRSTAPGLSSNMAAGMAPPPPPPPPRPGTGVSATAGSSSNSSSAGGSGSSDKPTGQVPGQSSQAKLAEIKKSPKKMILLAVAGILIVSILGLVFQALFGGSKKVATTPPTTKQTGTTNTDGNNATSGSTKQTEQPVTLVYWGLWEPNEVLDSIIADFESANPSVKIDYRVQSHLDYRERLQTAIASGNGPDIFRFHATWTPMLKNELSAMPAKVMSVTDYQKTFYPVAAEQLQSNGQIVGIPLMYDGLVLYYNKEILETANAQPPSNWRDLRKLANDLTVPASKDERGAGLERGGLAIGNSTNVEHFSDILALLILQNGGDINSPNSTEVSDALKFYTNFVKEDQIWDSKLPSSTVAFARGEAAMMFGPSWRAHEIKNLNPKLDFGMAPVPQLSDESTAWASYWAEGVSEKSKNKDLAWSFLKYMASKETQMKFFSSASQIRAFGEPYSRVELASELKSNESLTNLLNDALIAKSGAMCSYTHDNGINDKTIKYYSDAIDATLQGKNITDTLETLEQGVNEVMSQYQ